MTKTHQVRIVIAGLGLAVAVGGGLVWAQPPTPTSSLVGQGEFDAFHIKRKGLSGFEIDIKNKGGLQLRTQIINFPIGADSGWHTHPGPVLIVVQEGTMAFYDHECNRTLVMAGEGFLDTGIHPHMARNESSEAARNVVTYFLAPGTTRARDDTPPPLCWQE